MCIESRTGMWSQSFVSTTQDSYSSPVRCTPRNYQPPFILYHCCANAAAFSLARALAQGFDGKVFDNPALIDVVNEAYLLRTITFVCEKCNTRMRNNSETILNQTCP